MLSKWQVEEIVKCQRNAAYYVETYGWMRHPKLGAIRFTPWSWQTAALNLWQAGKSTIFNKSRQVGATWTGIGYMSWLVNFNPEVDLLVLSEKEEKAIKLLKKFYFFQDHLPDWLSARTDAASKTNFSTAIRYYDEGRQRWVDGNSSISSLTTTGTSGAGETTRCVLIDEFALMTERGHDQEVFAAIAPTATHGGQLIIISTPRGSYGEFYRIFTESVDELVEMGVVTEEVTNFDAWNRAVIKNARDVYMVPLLAHYSMGTHNEAWLRRATSALPPKKANAISSHVRPIVYKVAWRDELARRFKLSEAQVMQEMELQFEMLGNAAFSSSDINACYMNPEREPWVKDFINRSTHFYIGIDTAEGITLKRQEPDYNSLVVYNEMGVQVYALNNRETIDEWAGKTTVDPVTKQAIETPGTVLRTIKKFAKIASVTVVLEKNGPGLTVQNRIEPHLPDDVDFLVLSMTGGIKPQLVSDFAAEMADEQVIAIENGRARTARKFIFTDRFTVRCLRQYIKIGPGKFSAAVGFFDDPVVASMWAAYGKRILGARDGVMVMPVQRDESRPIAIDKIDDLTADDMSGYGPQIMPKEEEVMAGVATNPYVLRPDQDLAFGELTPRSLGGKARSLGGRK